MPTSWQAAAAAGIRVFPDEEALAPRGAVTWRPFACYGFANEKEQKMAHKFEVGQLVEYKPIGAKVGLFKIVRHMPEEFQAADWKYRIKSQQEGFERTVLECDLSPSIVPEASYEEVKPLRRAGGHH